MLHPELRALPARLNIGAGTLPHQVAAALRYLPRVRSVRGEEIQRCISLLVGASHARHPLVEELIADLQVLHMFIKTWKLFSADSSGGTVGPFSLNDMGPDLP